MELIYIYHSGFVLNMEKSLIVIDFYKDSSTQDQENWLHVEDLVKNNEKKIYILASHSHADHFNPQVMEWRKFNPDIQYILSDDIDISCEAEEKNIVFLHKGENWTDNYLKVKAYGSTDIGISFLLEIEGKIIFHAGDLNNWHWMDESEPQEIREAEQDYLNELNALATDVKNVDLVMFPVDYRLGREYMKGAKQFVDKIKTGVFVPMHFWENYEGGNAFKEYAENKGIKFVALYKPGQKIEIE